MKIKRFTIKNFKCLGPEPITIDFAEDIVVLIGENNVGKSSVLDALDLFFSGTKTVKPELFFNQKTDEANAIEITGEFGALTEGDKAHQAVKSYVWEKNGEEVWVLKKRYFYPSDKDKCECEYCAVLENEEKPNPGGRQPYCDDLYTNDKMQKIFVHAVKDVEDEAAASSNAAFGQIFNLMIETEVKKKDEYGELEKAVAAYRALFEGDERLERVSELEELITKSLSKKS